MPDIIDEITTPDGDRQLGFDTQFWYQRTSRARWKRWHALSWTEKRLVELLLESGAKEDGA